MNIVIFIVLVVFWMILLGWISDWAERRQVSRANCIGIGMLIMLVARMCDLALEWHLG